MRSGVACALMVWAALAWHPPPADAMTAEERALLAGAFAPVFLFHSSEQLFPVSPLDPLFDAAPVRASGTAAYEAQPREQRLAQAVVFFRVAESGAGLRPGQVRIEYWLYYAANRYRMHGALIPFKANGNHPHDLEHLFLILDARTPEPRVPDGFLLREVWASAHVGSSIPSNHYQWSIAGPSHLQVLIELGSHAMAPDVNVDGRYTVSGDSSGDRTFVWGIRDRGDSWARFKPQYADSRSTSDAVRLYQEGDEAPDACGSASCAPYRLAPAETLDISLPAMIGLIASEREVHASRHWAVRLFGDVDDRTLLAPALHPAGRNARVLTDRPVRAERGIAIGFTPVLSPATGFVSARYATNLGTGWAPKGMVNVTTLLLPGRAIGEVDASIWYPIDAITKVLAGAQTRSDLFSWEPTRRSLHAGVEFRLGRWRWRVLARNGAGQSRAEFKMDHFLR